MSATKVINKKNSLILDNTNINNTNNIPNNKVTTLSLQNKEENPNNINNKPEINNNNFSTKNLINNKIAYSLTESDINKQQPNFPKGEPTEFNLNLNGEIKSDKSKQEKTVVCWNCQSLLLVKPHWQIVECSECNKLNRILNTEFEENNTRQVDIGKRYGNLNNRNDVPYIYGIAVCPMCETENKFSKNATNINCYKCGFTIFLKDSPFNNGINRLSQSYDFTPRNYPNYGYINPPPYNPNVIQIRGLIPVPPMIPQYNNDYTLLKILELLKKKPKKTYVPYPMFPYYKLDEEPKPQIRYIPFKERKEPKEEDFKITIRKKPKNKYKFNGFRTNNNNAFEKVFFTKLK
jgi:DNA-directed RNA polymerase subunit RPC12/RpoP